MTLDKHRVPGSVDKHLPDLRSQSVSTDDVGLTADGEIPQDVNSSRSSNTWETNTTGHPIEVVIQCDSAGGAASLARVDFHINDSQTNRTITAPTAQNADSTNSTTVRVGGSVTVPPGADYKVIEQNGGINGWYETKLGAKA